MKLLQKEIAYPGTFVDMSGATVELSGERLRAAVMNTAVLMGLGFRVLGYSSHTTNDSKDVMVRWLAFKVEPDGRVIGIAEPVSEEAGILAEKLDTSLVLEAEVPVPGDMVLSEAITRVDIVGQGAVIGTAPFTVMQLGQPLQGTKALRFSRPALSKEKTPMAGSILARALAKSVGMQEGSTIEQIEEHLVTVLELVGMAEDESMEKMAGVMSKAFAVPNEPPAPPAKPEAEKKPTEKKEAEMRCSPAMQAQVAEQNKEIESLQDDKVQALFATEMPDEEVKKIKAQFAKVRKAGGFALAYEIAKNQVALLGRAVQPSGVAPRVVPRPAAPAKPGSPEDPKVMEFSKRLADAAVRLGHKPKVA